MRTIACVLLAAGNGTRFGGDKLLAAVNGSPMIAHAVSLHAALPYALRVAVIRADDDVLREKIDETAFAVACNPAPENGISGSVRIGLAAVIAEAERRDLVLDGVLFSVCDQPWLKRETVGRMMALFSEQPDRIVVPAAADGQRGNPAIFPAKFFPALLQLTGDRGGGKIIAAHSDCVLLCPTDPGELDDVDLPADVPPAESALASGESC